MIHIAINGCGKVGKALLQHLTTVNTDLLVTFLGRSNGQWISRKGEPIENLPSITNMDFLSHHTKILEEILDICPIDIWFELTPTDLGQSEAVFKRIETLLDRGVSVVLANKSPVLFDYMKLKTTADRSGVKLGLSAVMGASLPSFAVGHYGTLGTQIKSMKGILNGTSNLVLDLMEKGNSFDEAILEAIERGIAEPNWSYDVDGIDSAIKMAILASVILNRNIKVDFDEVKGLRTIDPEAFRQNLTNKQCYKLVAEFAKGKISVMPSLFSQNDIFFHVTGANKALWIETTTLSNMTIIGGQSGLSEVAASMYRDLLWIIE